MFMTALGHGECVCTVNATGGALKSIAEQLGDIKPNVGIVFAGMDFDHSKMLSMIKEQYPDMDIIGCTTAGEFSSALGAGDDSVSILVFASDVVEISVGLGTGVAENPQQAALEAITQARKGITKEEKFCITFPHGLSQSPEDAIEACSNILTRKCPVFGGMAGSLQGAEHGIRQFYNDQVIADALPMLIFAGPVEYSFSIARSWSPIGKTAVITEAEGTTVRKIDGENALDFYSHYLGR